MTGQIFQLMIKHTYSYPSKTWDELSNYKTKNWAELFWAKFESWAELAWANFYMGRVGFGPSCPVIPGSDEVKQGAYGIRGNLLKALLNKRHQLVVVNLSQSEFIYIYTA